MAPAPDRHLPIAPPFRTAALHHAPRRVQPVEVQVAMEPAVVHVADLAATGRNRPFGPASVDRPVSDERSDEERWHTIGAIGGVVVIVAHTWPEPRHGTEVGVGRIFSARKATADERGAYEEGNL